MLYLENSKLSKTLRGFVWGKGVWRCKVGLRAEGRRVGKAVELWGRPYRLGLGRIQGLLLQRTVAIEVVIEGESEEKLRAIKGTTSF